MEGRVPDAEFTKRVIGAAMRVHTVLGPGLLESVYESGLAAELSRRGFLAERQVPMPAMLDGFPLDGHLRADIIVDRCLVVEVKVVRLILPVHKAQCLTYLRAAKLRLGLLMNFNVPLLAYGIKRVIN